MDSRCWGGGGNLDKIEKNSRIFGETIPHIFNICTKYNAYMTPGSVFCKTTKWVNKSTSWSLGGTFVLLTRFVPFVVPIENCIPWIFKTASVSHDRWLKLLRRWKVFCYAAISSNPCHHWWNCGDFLRLSFGHSLVEKIVLSRKLTFKGICWRGLMKRSLYRFCNQIFRYHIWNMQCNLFFILEVHMWWMMNVDDDDDDGDAGERLI